jgi:ABC-type iron transport system FetAB ATPase subunit
MLLDVKALGSPHFGPVSFSLDEGELCFLTGPSGSGKSLLLRALADLDPHAGEVFLAGEAQAELPPGRWRCSVGLLPSESAWWRETVGEHFRDRAAPAGLEALGFSPEAMGWSIARLSTGERQRLALLRLLENRPAVLLLDEPSANLDPELTRRLVAFLDRYRDERRAAVLWVSHDEGLPVQSGARRLRLREGRLLP